MRTLFVALALVLVTGSFVSVVQADPPPPPPGMGGAGVGAGGNAPPVVTSAQCAWVANGGYFTISGTATDDASLAGCTVTVEGPNISTTTVCDANGNFTVTVQVPQGTSGTIVVTVFDAGGLSDFEYTFIDY